jgi:hypothetical protein
MNGYQGFWRKWGKIAIRDVGKRFKNPIMRQGFPFILRWLISEKTMMMRVSKTLAGLKSIFMAGQWVEPGCSASTELMSGCNVTQILCMRDKRNFVATFHEII